MGDGRAEGLSATAACLTWMEQVYIHIFERLQLEGSDVRDYCNGAKSLRVL